MKSIKAGKTAVTLTLLGVFLLLLLPLGLSQTPPGRFSRFPFIRTPRIPNLNSRLGRNLPFVDMSLDVLDPVSLSSPFAVVQGTVLDENGKPAGNVAVTIKGLQVNRNYRVLTDKNGQFTQSGIQAGDYLLQVEHAGKVGLDRVVPLTNGMVARSDFDLKFFSETSFGLDLGRLREALNTPRTEDIPAGASFEQLKTYAKAKDAMARGDYEAAIPFLRELLEKTPGEALYWRRLGECQFELHNFADAFSAFHRAMELKPEVADYPGLVALSLLFLGKLDEAAQYTEKTASLDKLAGADAYYNFGLALTDAGEVVKAEAAFSKATELNDLHPDAFFQLGLTLLSTHSNNLSDARKPLERFLKLAPTSEDAPTAQELIAEIDSAGRKGR